MVHQLWPARQAALIDAMVTAELRKLIVLLEGGAQKKVERHIALNHPGANLLKVGHHDSAKATTPELVTAVKPAFAVICVA
jgi:beta-lactamase superfamily II metal-dependent hydrolase